MVKWALRDNRVYRDGIAIRPIDLVKEVKSLQDTVDKQDDEIERLLEELGDTMAHDHQVILDLREEIQEVKAFWANQINNADKAGP